MAEHYPTKSVAVLAEQAKVTGYSQPDSNATQVESNVGDEINALGDAQIVSTNAPEFVPKADDPLELQKGPAKKYIDAQNGNNENSELNETNDASNTNTTSTDAAVTADATNDAAASVGGNDTGNGNDNGGGYDDFFGGLGNGNDENNTNDDSNKNENAHPNNATFISLPDPNEVQEDVTTENVESKQEDAVPTALSLWEQERREVLRQRIESEKEKQRETQAQADKDLTEFIDNRHERVNKARNEAKSREENIRAEYDSVYKNGTIWEQVAKLVDLTSQDENVTRMRDLLIELKNQGKIQK